MKNKTINFSIFLLLLSILTACQPTPTADIETETPEPDPTEAQAVIIDESNAESLEVVLSEAISTGSVNLTWTAASDAIWSEDLYTVLQYDGETAMEIGRFVPGMYSAIYDASPDGKTIAYAVETDDIRLYDLETEQDEVVITTGFPYSNAFFSPDGETLAVPSLMDIKVVFFDTDSGEETGSVSGFSTAAPVYSATYSPDGKTLLWFSRGTVQPMDIATEELGPVLSHEDFVTYQAVSPDGKVVATTAAGMVDDLYQPLLTLWNAASGNAMAKVAMPTYYTAISFSPDSKLIAAGTEEGIILLTSPYGEEVGRYQTAEAITDIEFSPDGSRLATSSNMGLLQIYMP